ncbi:hypothetical protein FGB62_82g040 [Gracilaria domingensis]|nr:hypothetical protein FGB62_82g040 [Gracilaria domingensis]
MCVRSSLGAERGALRDSDITFNLWSVLDSKLFVKCSANGAYRTDREKKMGGWGEGRMVLLIVRHMKELEAQPHVCAARRGVGYEKETQRAGGKECCTSAFNEAIVSIVTFGGVRVVLLRCSGKRKARRRALRGEVV